MNSPFTVAVVDDDAQVGIAIGRLLRSVNVRAEVFESGKGLLDWLNSNGADCIVMDLNMPQMNGLDVLRELAQKNLTIPVVIITGGEDPTTRAECLSCGATAYLHKPLDSAALLDSIRNSFYLRR